MTENELARALFGRREREARESGGTTVTVTATATADSAGGMVPVDFGTDILGDDKVIDPDTGEVVYAPPSQSVEVPVAGGVSAGDTVSVLIVDGTPVQAIGTGSVDRVSAVADAASTAAQEAKDVAEATGQHFWHDTRGAHVTEAEREDYETQASGFQQLMTSIGTLLTRAVNGIEYLLRSDTQSGMAIYDGTCTADDANLLQHVVASFAADGAQIGTKDNAHVEMDFNSFNMVDKDSNTFFSADDLRGSDGLATLVEAFRGDGTTRNFYVPLEPDSYVSVTDSSHEGAAYTTSGKRVSFSIAPSDGAIVTVTYNTASESAKVYTLGVRASGSVKGAMSVAEGNNVTASGFSSHVEGGGTIASGNYSHAEGYNATASGIITHAEGYNTTASGYTAHAEGDGTEASGSYSHAEGNDTTASGYTAHAEGDGTEASGDSSHAEGRYTTASGNLSHAEGYDTTASGDFSHAEGEGTIASGYRSHVEGKYNIADTQNTYAHIIGDGLGSSSRSNLHTVDWNGTAWYKNNGNVICSDGTNVKCAGQTIGTADNLSYVISKPNVNWQTLIDNQYGFVQYCRYSGVVYISYQASHSGNTPAVSGEYIIGTLPVGFRPGAKLVLNFVPVNMAFHQQTSWWTVETDGKIRIRLTQAMPIWGTTNYPAS